MNPTLGPWSRSNTPTQAPSPVPPVSGGVTPTPAAPMGRPRARTEDSKQERTARQMDFVFPPRSALQQNGMRARSKLSSSVPTSDDEAQSPARSPEGSRLHPHGPAGGHGRGIGDLTMSSSQQLDQGNLATFRANYREVRASRGLPDITIPPIKSSPPSAVTADATDDTPAPADSPTQLADKARKFFGRRRSQSSAAAPSPSVVGPRERTSPFRHEFHFPPASATLANAGPSLPLPILSPSHKSSSSGSSSEYSVRSPSSHQVTHSLDNGIALGPFRERNPSVETGAKPSGGGGLNLPPSLSRTQSANLLSEGYQSTTAGAAVVRRPSVTRQASVAVMEGAYNHAVITARTSPDRAAGFSIGGGGSGPNSGASTPVPGLKDVLKIPAVTSEMRLGMADLLPPSPSAASANRRFFAPTPSSLSASITPTDVEDSPKRTAEASVTARQPPPSPVERQATDQSTSTSSSHATTSSMFARTHSHTTSASSAGSVGGVWAQGPPVRPLDLGSFMGSQEATHTALAQTVDELVAWLGVVEAGLSAVLIRGDADALHVNGVGAYAGPLSLPASASAEDAFLEQVMEGDEDADDDDEGARMEDFSPIDVDVEQELPIDKAVVGDVDTTPGTFEQFLRTRMETRGHSRARNGVGSMSTSDYSSDGGGGGGGRSSPSPENGFRLPQSMAYEVAGLGVS